MDRRLSRFILGSRSTTSIGCQGVRLGHPRRLSETQPRGECDGILAAGRSILLGSLPSDRATIVRTLAASYRRLRSVKAVAEEYGVAFETARRWLLDANVVLRPPNVTATATSSEVLALDGGSFPDFIRRLLSCRDVSMAKHEPS